MHKYTDFDGARDRAEKEKCAFGMHVAAPLYFVGTVKELEQLAVVIHYDYSRSPSEVHNEQARKR